MAYQVLARKWRPQRFEDVVGQEHVTTTLCNAIAQKRIAHAFLFSGPRGVGKTTVARLLAKALNCATGPTGEPCGTCPSCSEVTAGSALDVVEIDGASNTSVENVRDLNENVRYRPAAARFKIYIIDEVHMLSTAAFNALLKTLEEPPDHVKFIFATTEVHRLPQTVVSRCQRYEFKRIPIAELLERLQRIVAEEGVKVSEGALFALAREADGSMRDAQSLLDQVIVFAGKAVEEADVRAALGVADRTILHQVTEAILQREPAPCLRAVDELYRYGYEVPRFSRDLVQQVRNLTVAALFGDPAMIADLPDNEVRETLRQAKLRPADDLQRLFRLAQAGAEEARKSMLPKLVLEMTLVKMATMPDAAPLDDLIARLEEMERRLAGSGGEPPGGRGGDGKSRAQPAAGPARGAGVQPGVVRPVAGGAGPAPLAAASAGAALAPAPVVAGPSGAAPSARAAAAGEREAAAASPARGWAAFLAAAQAKVGLRMCLSGSRPLAESADLLHIGVESTFAERALASRENQEALEELAARAYGGSPRIEISVLDAPEDAAARRAAEVARTRALDEQARASATVRSALEILGGEITDVRPRGRGGEP
jgi:DNA polymerase-3 subunit gamma/tau